MENGDTQAIVGGFWLDHNGLIGHLAIIAQGFHLIAKFTACWDWEASLAENFFGDGLVGHGQRDHIIILRGHVAIFDEAQRAWTKEQTVKFMHQKKGIANFQYSEPEFLISCLDRHEDWAVIVCLVGGGQEINTGEAGISEWLSAVKNKFEDWETRISPNLIDTEYNAQESIKELELTNKVVFEDKYICLFPCVLLEQNICQSLSKRF